MTNFLVEHVIGFIEYYTIGLFKNPLTTILTICVIIYIIWRIKTGKKKQHSSMGGGTYKIK